MKSVPESPTIAVIGGAGGMGRVAAEHISEFEDIGELIVADIDLDAAELVVASLRRRPTIRLRAAAVDVTDREALGALLADVDIVLNAAGPFYKLGIVVLGGAIAAGCHYLDICDDWEPTVDLLSLNDWAAESDVLAVVGMGASPGVSNLLAKLACDRLDRVEDLYTAWPVDAGKEVVDGTVDNGGDDELAGGVSAALVHWMQQISGKIDVVESGELVSRRPLAPVRIEFPRAGSGTGYTVGHPEPITLRTTIPVHGASVNLMLLQRTTASFLGVVAADIDGDRLTHEDAGAEVIKPSARRLLRALARSWRWESAGDLPFFFALAHGQRAGRPVTVGARVTSVPPGMDGATSIPFVLALRQLLDGQLEAVGVHPPESVIDAVGLLDSLAPFCQPPRAGYDDLVVIAEA